MVLNVRTTLLRNPGPGWGSGFLLWAERWWPRWIFRPALMAGAWVALVCMPDQRAHSREYLAVVLGRRALLVDVWRHFFAFTESLMLLLRTGRGAPVRAELAPEHAATFDALMRSDRPALFGTFHFGCSDLLGYLLSDHGRKVVIVRLRVGNSTDTRLLGERYADKVSFLWVNDPANLLFELKDALQQGNSLALKCDRLEFSAKTEVFRFLGAPRRFPFTVYHLAVLFQRPVVFCTAIPGDTSDAIRVFASTIYEPDPAQDRATNLEAARVHFQAVLEQWEVLVRLHPMLWFNFLPLSPAVRDAV